MRWIWVLLSVVFFAWLIGLVIFAGYLPKAVPEYTSTDKYEAAVVLTGGSGRIDEGMWLYSQGVADKLYITGAGKGIDAKALVEKYHSDHPNALKITDLTGIDVDDKARSTVANARYTKAWVNSKGVKKALLITAGYHMPRSELIFKREIPQVNWVASPVYPENYHPQFWWKDSRALMLVISEFHKYVFTYVFA